MVPGSLPLATAPPWFPCRMDPDLAHLAALGCGFVMADSVRESGAEARGKMSPLRAFRIGNQPGEDVLPLSRHRGLCGCAASPVRVFSAPALGTRSRPLSAGSGTLSSTGTLPVIERSTEKMQMGTEAGDERKGEQPTAQRKTACCNCLSWWKRPMDRVPQPPRSVLAASQQEVSLTESTDLFFERAALG